MVWLHAPDPRRLPAMLHLANRLSAARGELCFLVTTEDDKPPVADLPNAVVWQKLPSENPADVSEFLAYWQPDALVWSHGTLKPGLLAETERSGIAMYLVDAEQEGFEDGNWRWLRDLSKATLARFRRILAADEAAARLLRKLGAPDGTTEIGGMLQDAVLAPSCNEPDREALMEQLAGRPVWLAAHVRQEEEDVVLAAHRAAQRGSHRLLLILVPATPDQHGPLRAKLKERAIATADWSAGGRPDDQTQVLLAESGRDLGLWYRIAPMCFMGSSLAAGFGGRDPYAPASLGSAVLYGPHVGRYLRAYSRLAAVGAARIVRDEDTLSAAVSRMIAPDQTAAMALAAWELLSKGAELTDRLVEDLLIDLDEREFA